MKMKLKGSLINIEIFKDFVEGTTTIQATLRDTDISMDEITGNMFPDEIDCMVSWKKKEPDPPGIKTIRLGNDLDRLHKKW